MVRYRKVKKVRRLRLEVLSLLIFMMASIVWLSTSLFLRTFNNSLAVAYNDVEKKISVLKLDNEDMQSRINKLSTQDRVVAIANDAGLSLNQGNIVTISNGQ